VLEELRRELAVATRMLVDASILNYSGHLSTRVPGVSDELLVQPVDEPRAGLRPETVLRVRFDGTVIEGEGRPPSELAIHTGVYLARPDVAAVAHFHHDPTTVFSMVEGAAIVPVKNHASRWAAGVPVHPDPSHISTYEQGAELAVTLGSAHAALLRSHGEVVVAEDVPALFTDVVHFVENADTLARAMTLGTVVPLRRYECERFLATFDRRRHARKVWRYATSVAVATGSVSTAWLEAPRPAAATATAAGGVGAVGSPGADGNNGSRA
jgi:ribulose-5-phosphate 4-epimerase/fuculose-1-phosphate aldolase